MPGEMTTNRGGAVGTQIAWSRLIGLTNEASVILAKTSFSPIVRESHDFSCVLLNATGEVIAQEDLSSPTFVYSLQQVAQAMLRKWPDGQMRPGNMYLTNDPWLGSADMHDVHVIAPVFRDGELVAFAGNVAHWPDVGGRQWSSTAREVFEEGLRIPPMPLMTEGVLDENLTDLIRANTRLPDQAMGDLRAQILANRKMDTGLNAVLDEGLIVDFGAFAAEVMDRSEAAMRAGIAEFPDGVYTYTVRLDGLEERLSLEAAVIVSGDAVRVDFTGSSGQVDGAVNSLLNYTVGAAMIGVRAIMDPATPNNAGALRPVEFVVPEGTIANARPPVGTGGRHAVGHFATMAVLGALSQADAGRGYAEYSNIWPIVFTGSSAGAHWAGVVVLSSGVGARSGADGWSCRMFPTSGAGTSIEILENTTPLLVRTKRFSPGSGGPGRFRGGLGQDVEITLLGEDSATMTTMTERVLCPPRGAAGGEPGRGGQVAIDGREIHPKAFERLEPGQVVSIRTSGGGGWGSADERDHELSRRDERDGLVAPARAAGADR